MTESILQLVRGSLDDEATLHSLTLTGEDGGTVFVSVIYSEPYEGDVMLKERFFAVDEDVEDPNGRWIGQGINRRVTGDFPAYARAMVSAYARVQHDANNPEDAGDDPLLSDARKGRGSEVSHRLDGPIGGRIEEDEDDGADESPIADRRHTVEQGEPDAPEGGRSAAATESPDPSGGVQPSYVVCEECGEKAKRAECVNIGGALGADVWVHKNACPEGDADE